MNTLKIVIAPSGFKESLSAEEVAQAIATGVRKACPSAQVSLAPLVDGGEGFTATLVRTTGGTIHNVRVTGPVGRTIDSHFGFLGGNGPRTAVLEMAAAAGLRLVPRDQRNPLRTTTYGVGELIRAALDAGAERILLGCGDSGTNDGGTGMARALGAEFRKADGTPIEVGGEGLQELDHIDLTGLDPRLAEVRIDVACNIHNILCGPRGVARVFGPQKGASPETVATLEYALDRYATVIHRELGMDVRLMPGSGASGGLGAGLHALLGATLHPRYDIVMQYLNIDDLLAEADLVFTAEGGIDFQTPQGKIPAEVARRARQYGIPVIVLAGTIGQGARDNYQHGIASFASILQSPSTLEEAIARAQELTVDCAERTMRMVLIGQRMNASQAIARSTKRTSKPTEVRIAA